MKKINFEKAVEEIETYLADNNIAFSSDGDDYGISFAIQGYYDVDLDIRVNEDDNVEYFYLSTLNRDILRAEEDKYDRNQPSNIEKAFANHKEPKTLKGVIGYLNRYL